MSVLPTQQLVSRAESLYCALHYVYPPTFRRTYGADIPLLLPRGAATREEAGFCTTLVLYSLIGSLHIQSPRYVRVFRPMLHHTSKIINRLLTRQLQPFLKLRRIILAKTGKLE